MIRSFITLPPNLSQEERVKANAVRALLLISVVAGFLIPVSLTTVSLLTQSDLSAIYLDIISGLSLCILSIILMAALRRGYIVQSAYIYLTVAFIGMSVTIFEGNGVTDPLISTYFILLVFWGLIFGSRTATVFAVIAIATVVGFYIAEVTGLQNYPNERLISVDTLLKALLEFLRGLSLAE